MSMFPRRRGRAVRITSIELESAYKAFRSRVAARLDQLEERGDLTDYDARGVPWREYFNQGKNPKQAVRAALKRTAAFAL